MPDFAVPTLPMRDPTETRAFYEKLGFICAHESEPPDSFLFMMRNGLQVQFFCVPGIDGSLTDHTCYFYVDDLDATYAAFKDANVGKLMPIELKPWGVPEFVLMDINGNMLRIGCPRMEM
ncbi:MAG: VOC family protein [Alphaproteobacteria bacterium]|nr:VOC family protein [Alphaproteobacteria bacterium]